MTSIKNYYNCSQSIKVLNCIRSSIGMSRTKLGLFLFNQLPAVIILKLISTSCCNQMLRRYMSCKFVAFLRLFEQKTLKMTISTSVWSAQHPNNGLNIQHMCIFFSVKFSNSLLASLAGNNKLLNE